MTSIHQSEHRAAQILSLAAGGWRLFPVESRGKRPLFKEWQKRATCDANTLCDWAQEFPDCNWGLACGPGSGVWVLDVDGDDGEAAIWELCREHGEAWTLTLTAIAARGPHLYYGYPGHRIIRNSASKLARKLDVRGDGGYVVVPPSVHPSGHVYRWAEPDRSITTAPAWLLDLVSNQAQRPKIPASEIGILPEGRRNDGLTRLGGVMRRKGATAAELQTALLQANARRCRPPLTEREVCTIAASVARYEVGGPDPLEVAWQAMDGAYISGFEKFTALCRNLQLARPGQPIALPLERIGVLMGRHWTQVRRWRQRAVAQGLLRPVGHYVPHRKAAQYLFTECPTRADSSEQRNECPTRTIPLEPSVPLTPTTSGLVGHPQSSPSGTVAEHGDNGYVEGWL